MTKRVTIPPYDQFDLSTFVITGDLVHIGHFGGCFDQEGNLLTTIEGQMNKTLTNLENALIEIGLGLNNVVKLTVILKNIEDFHDMHSVWVKRFDSEHFPVRTVITSEFISENNLIQIEGCASMKFDTK